MDSVRNNDTGVSVCGHMINNVKCADDIDLLEEDREKLQENLEWISEAREATGMQTNTEITMTMLIGQENIKEELDIRGRNIENITEFIYLRSQLTWHSNCNDESRGE